MKLPNDWATNLRVILEGIIPPEAEPELVEFVVSMLENPAFVKGVERLLAQTLTEEWGDRVLDLGKTPMSNVEAIYDIEDDPMFRPYAG